jgi:hypothetical protein
MRYSVRATAQTSGREKVSADDREITLDIKDGNKRIARITVRDGKVTTE